MQPSRASRSRSSLPLVTAAMAVAFALLPWTWFLVRDRAPIMDLVAVVLPVVAIGAVVVLAVVAAVRRSLPVAFVALSVAAFTAVAILGPRVAQAGPPPKNPFRLVSSNVYRENDHPEQAADALLASRADVLVVIEAETEVADPLDAAYRHHIGDDLAIYTDYPIRQLPSGASIRRQRVVRARMWGPGGPFILYVVHQMNPLYDAGFAQQTEDLEALLARASQERQPVVLAGDFNMTDRSRGYREVAAEFRDAMRSDARAGSTYDNGLWSPLFLRIDHIFASPDWCASDAATFAVPGSDHRGVRADLGPCPATPVGTKRSPGNRGSPSPAPEPSPSASSAPTA